DAGHVDDSDIPQLLLLIANAFGAIADIANAPNLPADFKSEFPRQLADYVLVEYFLGWQPRWGYLLMALGLIQLTDEPAAGARPAFTRRVFAVENLGSLFSDPLGYLKATYKWGQPDFDAQQAGNVVAFWLGQWGLRVGTLQLDPQSLSQLNAGASAPDQATGAASRVVLFEDTIDPAVFSMGMQYFPLPETAADRPGFALLAYATGAFDAGIEITDNLTLEVKGGVDLTGGVGIFVRPNRDIAFLSNLASGAPTPVTGNLTFAFDLAEPGDPIVILG